MKFLELIVVAIWFFKCVHSVRVWDSQFMKNILYPLKSIVKPQEINWYLSEVLTTANSEPIEEFMIATLEHIGTTQMVLTNRTDLRLIRTESKKNYFCIVFTTGPKDPIMRVHDLSMLGRHVHMSFIVMVDGIDDFTTINHFMADLRERNFQNTFLYVRYTNGTKTTNELYGYTIFPEYKVESRTDLFGYLGKGFARYMAGGMDLEGYQFYSPLRQDLPGVFQYKDLRCRQTLQGVSYNLLKLFVDYINASLVSYEMRSDKLGGDVIEMDAALDLVREKKIPILAHAYALFRIDDQIEKSYPTMVVRWCLMVPIWNSVSTMSYPLQPFDNAVWYAIVAVFAALICMEILWTLRRGSHQLMQRISDCFVDSFCLTINVATVGDIKPPSAVELIIFCTIFFYGFFIAASYTSLLGSISAVTLFRAQINTMEDIIDANISVMIIDYELDFLLAGGHKLSHDFYRLLHPVDAATFNNHQLALNSTYAYFVTEEKWHFLELQQRYLKQGIFKFTDICFGSYHLGYAMERDSPIWRNLGYYLIRMHSSGMFQHYESISFDSAFHAGLVKRYAASKDFNSAGMQHLIVVFLMLMLMLVLSFLIFIGEIVLFRISNKRFAKKVVK